MGNNTLMGNIEFVNLCPHDVTLTDGVHMYITFKASGQVARLESVVVREHFHVQLAEGLTVAMPLQDIRDGQVYGLPEPRENTIFITSYIIAKHVRRPDVLSPLTDSTALRSEDNKVIGVKGFQRFA